MDLPQACLPHGLLITKLEAYDLDRTILELLPENFHFMILSKNHINLITCYKNPYS